MNHSIYSADRMTHLKVVIVALMAGVVVAGLSISGHVSADDGFVQAPPVVKADRPVMITSSATLIR